jgi:acyl carrier protein
LYQADHLVCTQALLRVAQPGGFFFMTSNVFSGGSVSLPSNVSSTASDAQADQLALERELAGLFVQALNLEVAPGDINPTDPLYGEGLGLDSIDILEVALEVSHRYGFQLRSDDENNHQIFQSLRSLAVHVAKHRTL